LAKETEIPKVPHQDHVDNFFDSQGVQHKEFVPEGKTVNAEYYKGVMDSLLKCIQQVCPAAFCSRDFFLLHDNVLTHKLCLPIFDPKNVTTLYPPPPPPTLHIYLRQTIFCSPKLKMKLKGLHFAGAAEIQETCN
jgi:hypothetical protein